MTALLIWSMQATLIVTEMTSKNCWIPINSNVTVIRNLLKFGLGFGDDTLVHLKGLDKYVGRYVWFIPNTAFAIVMTSGFWLLRPSIAITLPFPTFLW